MAISDIIKRIAHAPSALVDGLVRTVAPVRAVHRAKARHLLANYDAADTTSRTRQRRRSSSANNDLLPGLADMRRNLRAATRDDPAGRAGIDRIVDNVVGSGIFPLFVVKANKRNGMSDDQAHEWNRDAQDYIRRWWKSADASGHGTFGELQRQMARALVVDGEAFAHRVVDPTLSMGMALETIDCDRVVDPNRGAQNSKTRGGIEINKWGGASRYFITPEHPDENPSTKPIPFDRDIGGYRSIFHVFDRERSGQRRGASPFAAAYGTLENVGDMIQSELVAARGAAKFAAIRKTGADPNAFDPNVEVDASGRRIESIENGAIIDLGPNESMEAFSYNRPNSQFGSFCELSLRLAYASVGLPYEMAMMNWGQMNYTTMRGALVEARRRFEILQTIMQDQFCHPAVVAVIANGVLSGALKPPRGVSIDDLVVVHWQRPSIGWVDPTKEIEASDRAIRSNLSTPEAEAARQGVDSEAILERRAAFMRLARETEQRNGLDPFSLTDGVNESVARIYGKGAAAPSQTSSETNSEEPSA